MTEPTEPIPGPMTTPTREELIANLRAHAVAIRLKLATGDLSVADVAAILANQEYIMDALAEILSQPRLVR